MYHICSGLSDLFHLHCESSLWLQITNVTISFLKNTLSETYFLSIHYFWQREEGRNPLNLSPASLSAFTLPLNMNDLVKRMKIKRGLGNKNREQCGLCNYILPMPLIMPHVKIVCKLFIFTPTNTAQCTSESMLLCQHVWILFYVKSQVAVLLGHRVCKFQILIDSVKVPSCLSSLWKKVPAYSLPTLCISNFDVSCHSVGCYSPLAVVGWIKEWLLKGLSFIHNVWTFISRINSCITYEI